MRTITYNVIQYACLSLSKHVIKHNAERSGFPMIFIRGSSRKSSNKKWHLSFVGSFAFWFDRSYI